METAEPIDPNTQPVKETQTMKHTIATAAAVLAVAAATTLALAGCSSYPTADRQGPNGRQPDGYQDMTHVIVYRAPDQVPNIAIGCVGPYGFMSTLKSSVDSKSPSLVRFPEYDEVCRRG